MMWLLPINPPGLRARFVRRRALTIVEVLLAVVISLAILSSAFLAYIQISRATEDSKAYSRAHNRARAAVEEIGRQVAEITADAGLTAIAAPQQFRLTTLALPYGDAIDNDGDGFIDEEILNGRDDDGDWVAADHDLHEQFVGIAFTERDGFVGVPDLGDLRVDEDVLFSHDVLTFRIPASIPLGTQARLIRYRVGAFNTQTDVLLKEIVEGPPAGDDLEQIFIDAALLGNVVVEPVAFQVLSFDVLAWDPNENLDSPRAAPYDRPYWEEEWDASVIPGSNRVPYGALPFIPPFEFPAAIFVRVTVNAETRPINELGNLFAGNRPVKTAVVQTVVDLPVTTQTPDYDLFVRPFVP